jgi:DNA repair exonuclease SbcCD ATPase subunit
MKFPELIIENFLGITEAKINMADRGLVAIQGINHADTSATSNGASKSSLPDALCWCWFGTTARGESGDDVVSDNLYRHAPPQAQDRQEPLHRQHARWI